ncbi:MAG: peptide-methionine (S)-S-oxide reductase MsrA [Bacilli bacterium]|jgi:methionine-S-sulfoxide reductase|nr:peptide-methionine (S)-S-oxide reductase MsrA [Bacilli bacterium]
MKEIIIAGGCFWGVQHYFKKVKGIDKTIVGYINSTKNPISYEEVCTQKYDAIEGVKLTYQEKIISLDKILELLFRIIDPTSLDQQGGDYGHSYRVGAYYEQQEDALIIEDFIFNQEQHYPKNIVFENKPLISFCEAEEYHQDYLDKNPTGYCHVNMGCLNGHEIK